MAVFPYKFGSLVIGFALVSSLWSGCEDSVADLTKEGEAPIVLERTKLELGEIAEGETRIGQILITNRSANSVTINRVSATCGCTSAGVTLERIPPGETSVLNVELAPQGRRGPFGSVVTMEWSEQGTKGNRQGKMETVVQASGVFLVDSKPGNFDFGKVTAKSSSMEKSIVLTRGTQKLPFEDIKISSNSGAVQTRVEKRDKDSWIVFATLLPDKLPSGPARATLTAAFHDAAGEEIAWREFSARAELLGAVSAKPKSIFLGVMSEGETRDGSITFEFAEGKKAPIKTVRTEPEFSCLVFDSEDDSEENSSSAVLKYAVDTTGRKGYQSGWVFVDFQDESIRSVSVPYILHVK